MPVFEGIRPVTRGGAVRDALAGITLATMNIPQVLGYTRIAGTPVVTGMPDGSPTVTIGPRGGCRCPFPRGGLSPRGGRLAIFPPVRSYFDVVLWPWLRETERRPGRCASTRRPLRRPLRNPLLAKPA